MLFQHTVGLFRTVNMTPRLHSQRILLHDQRIYTEPDDNNDKTVPVLWPVRGVFQTVLSPARFCRTQSLWPEDDSIQWWYRGENHGGSDGFKWDSIMEVTRHMTTLWTSRNKTTFLAVVCPSRFSFCSLSLWGPRFTSLVLTLWRSSVSRNTVVLTFCEFTFVQLLSWRSRFLVLKNLDFQLKSCTENCQITFVQVLSGGPDFWSLKIWTSSSRSSRSSNSGPPDQDLHNLTIRHQKSFWRVVYY